MQSFIREISCKKQLVNPCRPDKCTIETQCSLLSLNLSLKDESKLLADLFRVGSLEGAISCRAMFYHFLR
jgi:hypothetical protein